MAQHMIGSIVAGTSHPAAASLRAALLQRPELGLRGSVVDTLVAGAAYSTWRAGQTIVTDADRHDLVGIVVHGTVRILCGGERALPLTVDLLCPGRFFRVARTGDGPPLHIAAVAHTPALVATVTLAVMRSAGSQLPRDDAWALATSAWLCSSRRLIERARLLALPLRSRLVWILRDLAREFGRPCAGGTWIDLPLTHTDLASMAGATRANVSRCVAGLRRDGVMTSARGQVVLPR